MSDFSAIVLYPFVPLVATEQTLYHDKRADCRRSQPITLHGYVMVNTASILCFFVNIFGERLMLNYVFTFLLHYIKGLYYHLDFLRKKRHYY